MSKKILIAIIIFFWISAIIATFVWTPKKTEYTIKVYYQLKGPDTLTLSVRGDHFHLSQGCIKDSYGNDYVCGVTRFEVIK